MTETGTATGEGLQAKVLTVSDGVVAGTREDRSGVALVERLTAEGYAVVDHRVCADGADTVAAELWVLTEHFRGLVVTTGGTGFTPRDQTPEGTKQILEREAPGLAEAMRLVSPLGRLSRAVAGVRGHSARAQHSGVTDRGSGVPGGGDRRASARAAVAPRRADHALSDCSRKNPLTKRFL